jgi:hypothetical protein
MWKKKEEKEDNLLTELCGDDGKLRDFLGVNLCENPLTAVPSTDLDTLIKEGEKSGNYRPAMDKAIFEGSQNLGEKERYVKVIRDLASKTIHATELEKEKALKQGLTGRAASLGTRIEDQRFMSERAEEIIGVASKFYKEKLVELGEEARREVRARDRRVTEGQERKTEELERAGREARGQETKKMGGEQKREAEKQGKIEDLAAAKRKETRGEERVRADAEEKKIGDLEQAGREARGKERRAN